MSDSEKKVVDFPGITATEATTPEEKARRVMAEATRLAGLPLIERLMWMKSSAERLGVDRAVLEAAVTEIVKDEEKKKHAAKVEERRQLQRVEKQRIDAERAENKKQEREQARIEREAERKQREKLKAFERLRKVSVAEREPRLAELARRFDEDVETVRDEFITFLGPETYTDVEPWAQADGLPHQPAQP